MEKKNKIQDWKEVWVAPFREDFGYITSFNDVMTFTVDMCIDPEDPKIQGLVNDIIRVLNGDASSRKYSGLQIQDGCDLYWDGNMVGYFRGWGHLTGDGGLHLPAEEAVKIQDQLINFVMDKIQ